MAISEKLLIDGERVVVSTRTHSKVLIRPVLLAAIILALAGWASTLVTGGLWYVVIWVVAAALILWASVVPFLRWLTTTYTFTNRRLISRTGVLNKHGRTIPLNRISGVDFEIGMVDRMFGCGTLIVTDASTNGHAALTDIPSVERVQLQVAELLADLGRRGDTDDGT